MSTLHDRMQILRTRLWPRVSRGLSWWGQTLASGLPRRWRSLLGLTRDRLLLHPQGEQVELSWQGPDGMHPLAKLPLPLESGDLDRLLDKRLAALPRWLLLPATAALRRPLLLPAAAAERLRDVVRFEIDRQTPFSADAVRYDARVRQRRDDGQVDVDLIAIARTRYDAALAPLGGVTAGLMGVDVADANGQPLGINLLPDHERSLRQTPMRGWHLALLALSVVALIFAGWRILDNRRAAADTFEAALRGKVEQARKVAAQRQQLTALVEAMNTLDRTRAQRPTVIEVLDELSRRLPDSTYLEMITIEGNKLVLVGLSSEASSLVAKLQGSALWRSPALSGALQPDQSSGRDRFTLTAQLGAAPATPAGEPATDGTP